MMTFSQYCSLSCHPSPLAHDRIFSFHVPHLHPPYLPHAATRERAFQRPTKSAFARTARGGELSSARCVSSRRSDGGRRVSPPSRPRASTRRKRWRRSINARWRWTRQREGKRRSGAGQRRGSQRSPTSGTSRMWSRAWPSLSAARRRFALHPALHRERRIASSLRTPAASEEEVAAVVVAAAAAAYCSRMASSKQTPYSASGAPWGPC